jgi:hypothetical protein
MVKRDYLGDSYDAVKRFWREVLQEWAPLYADIRYLPEPIRAEFTALTGIPMLQDLRPSFYSILNDPDTGVPQPGTISRGEGSTHTSLSTICNQLRTSGVRCVLTFDQSIVRSRELSKEGQRAKKLDWLKQRGVSGFYYVSHAPFLFAFSGPKHMETAMSLIRGAGMPASRLQKLDGGQP